jgi:predicted pyridoxine 5'-phosphate oxidase superfamily flavin-nucleotide-binding protein
VTNSNWHQGELLVQQRSGVTDHERLRRGVRNSLPPHFIDFISTQGFVVVAALDAQGRPWAFAVLGEPGLITVRDSTKLVARRDVFVDHAPMECLAGGGPIGLLVFDPTTRRRVRVNGTAKVDRRCIEITVQETFGNCQQYIQKRPIEHPRCEWSPNVVSLPLNETDQACIRQSDTCFLATGDALSGLDASHRGGRPGFVELIDDNAALRFDDYSGNNMFQSLGNISINPAAGMLFPDFETGRMLLLTGRARIEWVGDSGQSRRLRFEPLAAIEQRPDREWIWPVIEASPVNPNA